jgi:hypothetical protein
MTIPTVKEVHSLLRAAALREWQTYWDLFGAALFRHRVDPMVGKPPRLSGTRMEQVFYTRFRLGMIKTALWRHRVLKEPTRNCPLCGQVESIHHLLFACPERAQARLALERSLTPLNENTLLGRRGPSQGCPRVSKMRLLKQYLQTTGDMQRLQ